MYRKLTQTLAGHTYFCSELAEGATSITLFMYTGIWDSKARRQQGLERRQPSEKRHGKKRAGGRFWAGLAPPTVMKGIAALLPRPCSCPTLLVTPGAL